MTAQLEAVTYEAPTAAETETSISDRIALFRDTVLALIQREGPDLSARQMGILLMVYTQNGPHTVRGLAAGLRVSKPAVTRALDKLGSMELVRRKTDPADRRSVLAQPTLKGAAFVADLRGILNRRKG